MTEPVRIVPNSDVLFDWDNTLKKIEKNVAGGPPKLFSAVMDDVLDQMISKMNCRVFILTAISNSCLGCQTLKMEVERLGLQRFFCLPDQEDKCLKQETPGGSFWRWGNAITCGSALKADVYNYCCLRDTRRHRDSTDGVCKRQVYFFDDEINNIIDFEKAFPESIAYHVINHVPITLP